MSTTCTLPTPIPTHRAWWQRLADAWRERRAAAPSPLRPEDLRLLSHLSEHTLRDIGAPEWVHERDHEAPLHRLGRGDW